MSLFYPLFNGEKISFVSCPDDSFIIKVIVCWLSFDSLATYPWRESHSLKDSQEQVNLFKAPYNGIELILTSDIAIGEDKHVDIPLFNFVKNEKMYIKPDIFVGVKNKTTTIPIAFFELTHKMLKNNGK